MTDIEDDNCFLL